MENDKVTPSNRNKARSIKELYPVGLIAISLIILQSYISFKELDILALLSVIAFSISIPLLTLMYVINNIALEAGYTYKNFTNYILMTSLYAVSLIVDIIGIILTFFRFSILIGLIFVCSVLISLVIFWFIDVSIEEGQWKVMKKRVSNWLEERERTKQN